MQFFLHIFAYINFLPTPKSRDFAKKTYQLLQETAAATLELAILLELEQKTTALVSTWGPKLEEKPGDPGGLCRHRELHW